MIQAYKTNFPEYTVVLMGVCWKHDIVIKPQLACI